MVGDAKSQALGYQLQGQEPNLGKNSQQGKQKEEKSGGAICAMWQGVRCYKHH